MAQEQADPISLDARLDEPLSRCLWLVKWLLLIPHFVVLLFLGLLAGFATLIAFFAILFTRRYPRGLFDFNVGVLRWTWRTEFYGYYALATDKYPPFSLASRAEYPADLHIEYPETLNRWLPLVKWLLAFPHYFIIGVLRGGSGNGGGLSGILALIAGIVLLFTGRYPRGVYDLMMGVNLWYYRVIPYVLLMTDKYPPFRLDVPRAETPAA